MRLLRPVLLLLFASSLFAQNTIPTQPAATHTAAQDGQWGASTTWGGAGVPGANSVVVIPLGRKVWIAGTPTGTPKWITVNGILELTPTATTKLSVETIYVGANGLLSIGTPASRVTPPNKAEIVFISPNAGFDLNWDPDQMSRGLIADGKVEVYGAARDYMKPVSGNVNAGALSITLQTAPVGWRVGDTIVLTGSTFRRGVGSTDEKRTITGISANVVSFTTPLQYNHLRVSTTNSSGATITSTLHVANLTRPVIFKSDITDPATAPIYKRGHVFLRHKATVIENAAFENLGRTNKKVPLDDVFFNGTHVQRETIAANVDNRRGRYSVHIHETPNISPLTDLTPPTKIIGCVVNNTPGWGFANHSSYVDFQKNVAYDFDGAGFVTEDGDELGNFYDNIAIRGKGNGEYRKDRINFNNGARPQFHADFAFSGDGFWFQGPAVRVNNAIANGCNGAGVIWHTTGTVDIGSGSAAYPYGQYTFFPEGWIDKVFGTTIVPRLWSHGAGRAIIADLPILQSDNIQTYGNLVGIRQRFNNHGAIAWYVEYGYDQHVTPVGATDTPSRLTQSINNVLAWNNEQGIGIRYADKTNWTTVTVVGRLDHDDYDNDGWSNPGREPIDGIEFHHQALGLSFNGLTVDGYEIAAWRNANTLPIGQVTFANRVYRNYATFEAWNATPQAAPSASTSNLTSNSVTINSTGSATRTLVRYRTAGAQHWSYAAAAGTSVPLTGLTSATTYQYQVIGATEASKLITYWTALQSFSTP